MNPTAKHSPVRPVSDVIPAAAAGSDYTQWGVKSYVGLAHGIIVQSAVGMGFSSNQIYIGFNKQPPVLFNVRDSYHSPEEFKTVEIYNHLGSAKNMTITGIIYDGIYNPSPFTVLGSGLLVGITTSVTSGLQFYPTIGLNNGTFTLFVDSQSNALVGFQLRVDNTGTPGAGKVVPADWNAVTNNHSWFEVL